MKFFRKEYFLLLLAAAFISCAPAKEDALGEMEKNESIDPVFSQSYSGNFVSAENPQESLHIGNDNSFKKNEVYKVGTGETVNCKFSFQGPFKAFYRSEASRERFWKEATHLLKVHLEKIAFINGNEMNYYQQQTCLDFQKTKLANQSLEAKYYLKAWAATELRIFNTAQVTPDILTPIPAGVVYRRSN